VRISTKADLRFYWFSWAVLAALLGVILWGAYVRASGSGAGCGSHWPTCNGQIIPRSPGGKTLVEFTHRVTSGLAFLLVVAQAVWAFRAFPARDPVRRAAAWTVFLIITEALVGAGLVIFEQVGLNTSNWRALWMAGHLMNTFALLSAAVLTIWRSRPAPASPRPASPSPPASPRTVLSPWLSAALTAAMGAVLLIAMSGAVVALGDTLFRPSSLQEGLAQKYAPGAHLFVRLRLVHPVLAAAGGILLLCLTATIAGRDVQGGLRRLSLVTAGLVLAQMILGLLNLALLAPTALQILHLLLADLVWLSLVVLTAAVREQVAAAPVVAVAPAAPASERGSTLA
jgi:heme A synthase